MNTKSELKISTLYCDFGLTGDDEYWSGPRIVIIIPPQTPFLPNFPWCQFNSHLSSRCLIRYHCFQNALVNTYMLYSPPEMTVKTLFRYLFLNTITENPNQNVLFGKSAKMGFTRQHIKYFITYTS